MVIQIKKRATLRDIENQLASLPSKIDVELWLPRTIGPNFFWENAVSSLIAACANRGALTIIDWIKQPEDRNSFEQRFGHRLEGLASLVYARSITSLEGSLSYDAKSIIADIRDIHGGIMERRRNAINSETKTSLESSRGRSITFCAFDNDLLRNVPLVFMGTNKKPDFVDRFVQYLKKYFLVGRHAREVLTATGITKLRQLGGFIYELYDNTYQHGCLNAQNAIVPGFRFVRIKRHISHRKEELLQRAKGFTELELYLEAIMKQQGTCVLFEVSVTDHGIGIIDRFVATRPEYSTGDYSVKEGPSLLNKIIVESLSSKHTPGAGKGMKYALDDVDRLQGFVSLRSGKLWLFRDSVDGSNKTTEPLRPVKNSAVLARVPGSHFNLLFPMR